MWKYNCQKANKMFVLIKFIIMFAVRLEPLLKKLIMLKNTISQYCRNFYTEVSQFLVPNVIVAAFSFKNLYS